MRGCQSITANLAHFIGKKKPAPHPRRRSIEAYNQLFKAHQQIQAMGADTPTEMVFGVGVARWKYEGCRVNVPLIEQLAEVILEDNGTLIVKPRDTEPQLNLKVFHALDLPGTKGLQNEVAKSFQEIAKDPDRGFSPFEKSTFDSTLRSCAARLSSTGRYVPDDSGDGSRTADLPEPDDRLQITDTWVIYVRPRQENFREEDIQRIIDKVERAETEAELPACGLKFVEAPSDDIGGGLKIDLSGGRVGGGSAAWNPSDDGAEENDDAFFFPLPYNDDQIEIVRRLEQADGVVVQGPPGTGKTHTIANIICHYMATGRRILVTAKTAEALTALQEKIPESVRGLAISVIHNDREGASQLEAAVRILSNEAKQVNERLFLEQVEERERRIDALKKESTRIEAELRAFAEVNTGMISYGGREMQPMDLARELEEERPHHVWLDDRIGMAPDFDPRFDDTDLSEIAALRRHIGDDLDYAVTDIPAPVDLPDLARVLAAHTELGQISKIDQQAQSGELPYMVLSKDGALERARELKNWLFEFSELVDAIAAENWLLASYHRLSGLRPSEAPKLAALRMALEHWATLHSRGEVLILRSVSIAPDVDDVFDKAVADLAAGRQPYGLFSFLKGGLKAKIEQITIEGRKPSTADDWSVVADFRTWQKEVSAFVAKWNSLAAVVEGRPLPPEPAVAQGDLIRIGRLIGKLLAVSAESERRKQAILELFPYGIDAHAVLAHGQCDLLRQALMANLEKAELASATALKDQLAQLASERPLPFHSALRDFIENLGRSDVSRTAIAEAWQQIEKEATRLFAKQDAIKHLDGLVDKIRLSGAARWATRLRQERPGKVDDLTPQTWRASWEWARARGFIESLPDRARVRKLTQRLQEIEEETKRLFVDIVRLRTFIGLKQSMSPKVHTALAKFISAVSKLGKGTGKSAYRHRRVIRESVNDAADAIPCWILPEWRVSEQLPAEPCAFDLAIIDEARQSDITALTAIMRSKKVLIVGDDKQVSPDPVGVEDREIVQLRNTYLSGLPFADQMEPSTSLYELGTMVYPGKTIMLREHFRCVEPIIRFSSQFYDQPLVPLRIPSARERLDPPLIDIYVPHGTRNRRKQNLAEAQVIVDEIANVVTDPAFASRSIGVISLIGQDQAKRIYDMLVSELGAEIMERHKVLCGDAATFQGQERDIMFLSMVACPNQSVSQTSRRYQQRFNVAMSRARDRVVLVRSVAATHLRPGDLKLKVIEHMRNPMGQANIAKPKEILELCQSGFEKEFARRMLELGYRLHAQVPVAGYSLDFVIEGTDNARLAVELDGDKYHGPERWAQDIHRQKALERLGWRFWRCWGSNWVADPNDCLMDLKSMLDEMGIEPLGATAVAGSYTTHIEVPPPAPVREAEAVPVDTMVNGTASGLSEEPAPDGFAADLGPTVAVGDLVIIRYSDAPDRAIRVRLSDQENRPEAGIVSKLEPLGAALIGAGVDDEVQVQIGGVLRTAAIERIEKRPPM
jgi:very-short-patch-repair endonuclease